MADIRINALPTLGDVAASDILHILDASTPDDVDKQTTVDAVADWIIANKSVRITGISDVPGLQAALDLKSNVGHTHIISEVTGLQTALDAKTDVTQAQIIGRNIVLNGKSINVPSSIGGLQDDRIPDTVVVGEYLQFGTTSGGINNITGDDLKGNIGLNLVDNTTDANKPISTATQTALDTKVDDSVYQGDQTTIYGILGTLDNTIITNTAAIALNTSKTSFDSASSTKLDGIEAGADVTDTGNVWSSLGISGSGSTGQILSQRGVFVDLPDLTVTKAEVDNAIGSGTSGTDYYSSNKTWLPIPTGGDVGVTDYDELTNKPIDRLGPLQTIFFDGTRTNVEAANSGTNEFSTITMLDSFNPVPTQYTSIFTSPNTSFTPALVLPTGSQGRQLSLTEADGTVHRFAYTTNGNYRLLDGGLSGTVRLGAVAVATTATVTVAVSVPDQTAGQTITLTGDQTGVFSVGDFISPLSNNFGAYRGIFIETITLNGGNTDIVGTSNGAATFQTTSTLYLAGPADTIQGTLSSFSYDPDTTDTVYSSAITSEAFTNAGTGITAHLTQIANSITALETDITWDGIITEAAGITTNVVSNSIGFLATLNVGINQWSIITNVTGFPAITPTMGDAWSTINGHFITESASTTNRLFDAVAIGDTVRFTWGAGSASFPVVELGSRSTLLGDAFNITGTIGRTFTSGESFTLVADVITSASSSITLDLGTETNIDSSFSIDGGLNNIESVVNTDGAPGVGTSAASTITLTDPSGSNVLSFTAGVALATDRNTPLVASTIEDYINNNTQSPIDYTAVALTFTDGSVVMNITGDRAGLTNPWNVTIDNNDVIPENAGNISINNGDVQLSSSNVVNEIDLLTIADNGYIKFGDGTEQNTAGDASLTADQTFTGANTFTDTTVFSDTSTDASIRVNAIEGLDTSYTSVIRFGDFYVNDSIIIFSQGGVAIDAESFRVQNNSGVTGLAFENNVVRINRQGFGQVDFRVEKQLSVDDFINVDASADEMSFNADTINFVANTFTGLPGITPVTKAQVDTAIGASSGGSSTLFYDQQGNFTSPSGGSSTTVLGTANEIDVNTSGNTATVSLNTAITSAITSNTAKNSYPTADATKLGTIETNADVTDTANVVGSLTAGTNITIATDGTISAASGGTSTTVLGTTGEIDVNTVGNTSTVSLPASITSAITANTAKTGITNFQATSIVNNTLKTGITTAQATAITNNTSKTGITTAQASAITANTSKTGITTAQASAITANTAKVSVSGLTQVGGAITATDSILYYDDTTPRRKVFSSVPLSIFDNDAGFVTSTTAGDAVLANDQTFTGVNTFSNTDGIITPRVFSSDILTLQSDTSIIHRADTNIINQNDLRTTFNSISQDIDFTVNKSTTQGGGSAFSYDAGNDTFTMSTDTTLNGVSEEDTGTWTPVFVNGGTITGTTVGTYSRSGNIVTINASATVAASTSADVYSVTEASLPFTLSHAGIEPLGSCIIGAITLPTTVAGIAALSLGIGIIFVQNDASVVVGNEVSGGTIFTVTYTTND